MRRHLARSGSTPPSDWGKGHAVASLLVFDVATCRPLLDRVSELLGDDVLLWGASLVHRPVGSQHPRHTDIESATEIGRTVTAWIGLANTNLRSSLQVVTHSHSFGVTLQETMARRDRTRLEVTDADVADWARKYDPRSELFQVDMRDGDAILFDGRLWHGSRNTNLWG
jgi:ectoine hydroxylase-related dioxygenase (phytanoyl-CoA dioxygenase family)